VATVSGTVPGPRRHIAVRRYPSLRAGAPVMRPVATRRQTRLSTQAPSTCNRRHCEEDLDEADRPDEAGDHGNKLKDQPIAMTAVRRENWARRSEKTNPLGG
jgi:hypothetical protein